MPRNDEEPVTHRSPDAAWEVARRAVAEAELYVRAGSQVPPMRTLSAISRVVVTPFVKLYLRLAQLVTREQHSFNHETIRALHALTEATQTHLRAVEARAEDARHAQDRAIAHLAEELERLRQGLDEARLGAAQRAASLEQALWAWRQESVAQLEAEASRAAAEHERMRSQLLAYERELARLADTQTSHAGHASDAAAVIDGLPVRLDAFYAAFEDRFRGPREEIRSRVTVHLPVVRAAGAGTADRPILDIGCGRGEWLELLAGEGLIARGVDANVATVAETRARGLDVVEADVLGYLRSLPAHSCGAVTGFHVIEHLPFATLVALVDEIVRVLQPGGVTILETPNPTNLMVGAATFYIDPTHSRPLHPETMRFLVGARGLERVEIQFLHPVEGASLPDEGNPTAARLNQHLYGPQDYAIVAYRR